MHDIVDLMAGLPGVDLALAYSPHTAREFFRAISPSSQIFPQEGSGLGERLAAAFGWGFHRGYTSVLIRNSDSPDLPAALVLEAAERLAARNVDMVLGPSPDGGYYLVGLRRPWPDLFAGVAWSTSRTLADTRVRAARLGLTVDLLPAWPDIDTWADLKDFARRELAPSAPGWRSHRLARELTVGRY